MFAARPEPTEILDYYYSACLSAAQSAFYALEKAAGKSLFKQVQNEWRTALPDDATRHELNDIIERRGEDVHYGDFNAQALPTMMAVDLDPYGTRHNTALFGPVALGTHTHPDGKVLTAQAMKSTRRLYIDRGGKTIDATTACETFIKQLHSLCEAVTRAASAEAD
jgi:hypothetical protein